MFEVLNHPECRFYQRGTSKITQQPLLFGISPGNSFFSESNISQLLESFCKSAPFVYLLLPDKPHVYNFLGLGYSDKDAIKKSRKESNITRNRLNRACKALIDKNTCKNFKILDWSSDISHTDCYKLWYQNIVGFYSENALFKDEISSLVETYLIARAQSRSSTGIDVSQASHYFLSELAAFIALEDITGKPVTIAYHKYFNIGLDYLEQEFPELEGEFSLLHYQLKPRAEKSDQMHATHPSLE